MSTGSDDCQWFTLMPAIRGHYFFQKSPTSRFPAHNSACYASMLMILHHPYILKFHYCIISRKNLIPAGSGIPGLGHF
ncbi:hypothetical protein A7K99_04225 [Tatumella citrea]|uniref:Uncharacterized protein n=1 Tax=Tatumella citrea TaxID=53336 RepID=A0A1Y0L4X9_TATCI|nr:hypothetical protein A7K98_04225 [Tatumella citrea]ARU97111.1 hypothetical protein A7K99_04225 [Tatumella citrea]